jgi:hypothetical protein
MVNKNLRRGLLALMLTTLACQPVIAVGGREVLVVLILGAVLLGPPLYRLIRTLESRFRQTHKDKTNRAK